MYVCFCDLVDFICVQLELLQKHGCLCVSLVCISRLVVVYYVFICVTLLTLFDFYLSLLPVYVHFRHVDCLACL